MAEIYRRLLTAVGILLVVVTTGRADEALTISVTTEQAELSLGEPSFLLVTVTNHSEKTVQLPVTWDDGYFRIKVTDGKRTYDANHFFTMGWYPRHELKALGKGKSYSRRIHFLSLARRLKGGEQPGDYKIVATLASNGKAPAWDKKLRKRVYRDCWAGKITSSELTVRVKSLEDPAEMKVLESLSRRPEYIARGHYGMIWSVNLDLALSRDKVFLKVLSEHPKSLFAKYCEYKLGEGYAIEYRSNNLYFEQAVRHCSRVVSKYPRFQYTDDAELWLARLYIGRAEREKEADQKKAYTEKAARQLRTVLSKYPKSDSSHEASKLLKDLAKAPARKDMVRKQAVKNGVEMTLSMRKKLRAGEPMVLDVTLRNVGKQTVHYGPTDASYRDFQILIVEASGKPVPVTRLGKARRISTRPAGSWKFAPLPILPGEGYTTAFKLALVYDLTYRGKYRLSVATEIYPVRGHPSTGKEFVVKATDLAFEVTNAAYPSRKKLAPAEAGKNRPPAGK